jgi:hypothetical protein
MIPALDVLKKLGQENLHFVLCNLNVREGDENFDSLLIELLKENKVAYTQIDSANFDYINAKNFIPINGTDAGNGIPALYSYLIKKYNMSIETPNKKIYVSRKNYSSNDIRIDSEASLEDYFIKRGFQVVYPEEMKTFREQFELFNSCSTLAALSGSGLTSLIFMQENQKVIEIVSELMVGIEIDANGNTVIDYEIHDHYKDFSIFKNHTYLSVQNLERRAELVKVKLDKLFASLD